MDGSNGKAQPFPYWMITFDGTKLRQRRLQRNLSQERLAYRARVSLGTIQRVEKLAAASCHYGTLQRLAAALGPDPDTLISALTEGFSDSARTSVPRGHAPRPRRDQWWQRPKPFPADKTAHGRYDAAMARELLAMTGEFPDTKSGMLILLTEYRHALYDVASGSPGKPG